MKLCDIPASQQALEVVTHSHLSGEFLKPQRAWDNPNKKCVGVQTRCLLVGILRHNINGE